MLPQVWDKQVPGPDGCVDGHEKTTGEGTRERKYVNAKEAELGLNVARNVHNFEVNARRRHILSVGPSPSIDRRLS